MSLKIAAISATEASERSELLKRGVDDNNMQFHVIEPIILCGKRVKKALWVTVMYKADVILIKFTINFVKRL